ncbi:EscF/YscF/HrpA family type III secretion system needle major subunit (plasmid) [Bradyrhizobium sp. 62B]|uniref:EscF/YscF/HrpA family type III secretion system needle major subunit n=1 Tax=Bradyrhizobium sp. 62B TaxID=2898442 RepID=UPI002557E6CB|nr:EscF/YscF/HrpA family type III secretion system needle major subunit [Bradyrhizobium sp. 62B]
MNFDAISSSLSGAVSESDRDMRSRMASINPTDTGDLIRLQLSLSQHTALLNLNSTLIKVMHEALNAVIRNIA